MNALLLPFCQALYPNKEPLYSRPRDKPMQVLALGISRSGTESLSKALTQLGYDKVYHGLQLVEYRIGEIPQWFRLVQAKQQGNNDFLVKEEFDKVLGHSMAVTDVPCCGFGPELMKAYPDAKVILNQRFDSDVWEKSIRATLIGRFDKWTSRIPLWFEHGLFWTGFLHSRVFFPTMLKPLLQSSDGMAREYERHYKRLRAECASQGRSYLEWHPEDGWEPLCKFLGKPVPQGSFPQGNTPADMANFSANVIQPRVKRAKTNMIVSAVSVSGVLVAAALYYASRCCYWSCLQQVVRSAMWISSDGAAYVQTTGCNKVSSEPCWRSFEISIDIDRSK